MNKFFFLILLILAGLLTAVAGEWSTNQIMIGDSVAYSKIVDGKLTGYAVVSDNSNHVFLVQSEISPIPIKETTGSENLSSGGYFKPSLRLLMMIGDKGQGPHGGSSGYHGRIYLARDFKNPGVAETNRVDILYSGDRTKIVLMISNNGPIYASTNSGLTWAVFSNPGNYEFVLDGSKTDGGWMAAATITSAENKKSFEGDWYAVGSASDGSKLVLTGSSSQPTPILSIKQSGSIMILSWPSISTGFIVQQNGDLTTMNWIDMTNNVSVVGDQNQMTIPTASPNNFYRLKLQSP